LFPLVRFEIKANLMIERERHSKILAHAQRHGKVQATPMARDLNVAVQTLRRDLRQLCASGLLERVHGGAVLPSGVSNIGYGDRRSLNRDAKVLIGERAAQLIPNNASLFLNIGTTTEAVARALTHHRNLMVVTNNLNVATILSTVQTCKVVVAGGNLRQSDGGLVGDLAALAIARFKVDIAVIGCSAIDQAGDLLDFDPEEVRVSREILDAARASMVVGDATKFSRKAPVRIGSLSEVDQFVTDKQPPASVLEACRQSNTQIYTG